MKNTRRGRSTIIGRLSHKYKSIDLCFLPIQFGYKFFSRFKTEIRRSDGFRRYSFLFYPSCCYKLLPPHFSYTWLLYCICEGTAAARPLTATCFVIRQPSVFERFYNIEEFLYGIRLTHLVGFELYVVLLVNHGEDREGKKR